ncbi:MAG: hypothetical protein R6U96_18105 [Promethearchaeia archaeon]
MEKENKVKKKISVGIVASEKDLRDNLLLPKEISDDVPSSPYFLLIFIPRKEILKISCFPTESNDIKKILIKLEEFSPDLVKGITEILKELDLSKNILHTTGLCYDVDNCYYETYLSGAKIDENQIREDFMEITKVIGVDIKEAPRFSQ